MRKIFLISFLSATIISCSKGSSLKSNSTITTIFNNSEIEDLETILQFFNNQICSTENKELSNINTCYNSFIQRMSHSSETGNMDINISFEAQKNLYKNISESTYNEIWKMSWKIPYPPTNRYLKSIGKDTISEIERSKQDTLNDLDLKYESKYVSFLKEYGKENSFIKNYVESFKNSGGVSPSMVSGMMMNYEYYDIKDERMKLVFAIHYLTLNDQINRKEKCQQIESN